MVGLKEENRESVEGCLETIEKHFTGIFVIEYLWDVYMDVSPNKECVRKRRTALQNVC